MSEKKSESFNSYVFRFDVLNIRAFIGHATSHPCFHLATAWKAWRGKLFRGKKKEAAAWGLFFLRFHFQFASEAADSIIFSPLRNLTRSSWGCFEVPGDFKMPSGQRVYVGNIPSDTRERDVEKFFKVSQEIQLKRFLRESIKNRVLFSAAHNANNGPLYK